MADQHETSPDQQWVVAYYDLLGIQREMDKWENPQATCGKIDLFRHALTRTLEKSVNRQLDLRNSRSPSFVHGRECEFLYFGFADTVVIASPVVNRFGWPQTMALSMLLMITVPLTAILLEDGILFRAGVEVGTARRVRSVSDYIGVSSSDSAANNRFFSGDIAGPAYVEAHSLASVKGSPGATTLACLVAASWRSGRRAVLVELDPGGGDLAIRFGLSPRIGWSALEGAARHGRDSIDVESHLQVLPGGLQVLAGGPPDASSGQRRQGREPEG